jgi:putative ABC transport system permease protein
MESLTVSIALESLWKDLQYAARSLRRSPGFAVAAILALGVGIGANNTLFTIVNAACLRGLAIVEPDRVLFVGSRDARGVERGLSSRDFEDLRAAAPAFAGLAAHASSPLALGEEGRAPDRVLGNYVSANTLGLLGEHPLMGRDFTAVDDRSGAPPVVMLGYAVWRVRYNADPAVIGRTVKINGVPSTVVGVMRDRFKLPANADIWLPLSQMPGIAAQARDVRPLSVFGRLAAGRSHAQGVGEVTTIFAQLAADYPETNAQIQPVIVPLNERYNNPLAGFITFIVVGGIIVLIACGNVANLLLMRSVQRSREIAMRASLGATRGRVVRQLLVESTLLAGLGGLLGLGLSVAGVQALWSATPANAIPYWFDYRMDARVFAVLGAVCLGAVFLFGLVPAMHLARTDVIEELKSGGRAATGGVRRRKWTTVLLAAQFGLSTIFVATAVNSERIGRAVRQVEFSIDMSPLLTMSVSLPPQKYRTAEERTAFFRRLNAALDATPGVSSSTMTSALPFGGAIARQLAVEGRAMAATLPTVWTIAIGPRYFETIALPVLGRGLIDADGAAVDGAVNAVVNQRFANLYFPNENPIGRRLQLTAVNAPATTATIVGISETLRQRANSGAEADPLVYLPMQTAMPATAALIVRVVGDQLSTTRVQKDPAYIAPDSAYITPVVREAVRALDPDLPIYRMMTMEQAVSDSRWGATQSIWISTTLISIAFALAIVGLYAVTAHAVAQRTPEIGIRIALGATRREIMALVLGRMLRQLSFGLAAGIVCTFAWERPFSAMSSPAGIAGRFHMTDPIVLLISEATIVVVALATCWSIAYRATRLDPLAALRHE